MADKKQNILYFNTRDELLKVNLDRVVYIEAEANYIRINLINGQSPLVRMALGQMENVLSTRVATDKFARIGKRFIVNLTFVFRINILKQELVLSDQKTFDRTLSISKEALKQLKDLMKESYTLIRND